VNAPDRWVEFAQHLEFASHLRSFREQRGRCLLLFAFVESQTDHLIASTNEEVLADQGRMRVKPRLAIEDFQSREDRRLICHRIDSECE
jgi:hypothetical protein